MLLPGHKATVSVGIAIGHVKSPMQDLIKTAREAEKTAKEAGKNGFCLTIKKRSGETNSFFAHWGIGDLLSAWNELSNELNEKNISNRFPYIYTQYIAPLLKGKTGKYFDKFDDDIEGACKEFLRITNSRQGENSKIDFETLFDKVKNTTPENYLNFWFCLAFMNRIKNGGE